MQLGGHGNYLDSNIVYTPAAAGRGEGLSSPSASTTWPKSLSRFGEAIAHPHLRRPDRAGSTGRATTTSARSPSAADVPVINMEDDKYHPCQGMADVMTMKEKLGRLGGSQDRHELGLLAEPQEAGLRAPLHDGRLLALRVPA